MAIKPLSAELDTEQVLVIPELETDMDVIQKLDDEPNDVGGLTAAQLKAEFDQAGNIIKTYINEILLPNISDTVVEAENRATAEAGRVQAETERETTEAARVAAETARAAAEAARAAADDARTQAEQGRVTAETQRETAEAARAAAEAARAAAEITRESTEQGRATAETQRETAEAARAAAEAARVEEHTGTIAQAREAAKTEADRAKWEADRAHQIVGGEFVPYLELGGILSQRAAIPIIGPASLAEELGPGGILFITDDGDPTDYILTLDRLMTEGDKANAGGADELESLLTVGRVKALNLRKNAAGENYAEGDLAALAESIRSMCAAAQAAGGGYIVDGKTSLTYRQVQYYLIRGVLVSHSDTYEENWTWSDWDPSGEYAALRAEVNELRALMGDLSGALGTVLDGNGET